MFKLGKKKGNGMGQQPSQSAGSGKNEKDIMYTTILASSTQKKLAMSIMTLLEKTGRVIVNNKSKVMSSGGTDKLIEYMLKSDVPGVVVLSSEELAGFLGGKGGQLQIAGQDVELNSTVIAEDFKSNKEVRAKILVVVPHGKPNECLAYTEGVHVLNLSGDKTSYGTDIVHKFMEMVQSRS